MNNKFLKGLCASIALAVSGMANAGLIYNNGDATGTSNRCFETSGFLDSI